MKRSALTLGLVLCLLCPFAGADEAMPKPLATLSAQGYQIGQRFDAGHGLTGWVVRRGTQSAVIFTTNDGEVVISGNLMDAQGQNLTAVFAHQYIARPELKPLYDDLAHATFVTEKGAGAIRRIVYVMFDPNCPYCSTAWKILQPHLANGLEIRWVPVAYLQANSAARAAAILGAKDPLAALKSNEEGFDSQAHQGGIKPADRVPDAVASALKHNEELMGRLGSLATPAFVWADAHDQIDSQMGLPQPLKMLEIVGMTDSQAAPAAQ